MLTYICLGLIFAWVMELLIHNHWNPKQPNYQKIHFNTFERIIIVCLWPIWLVKAIENYINKRK